VFCYIYLPQFMVGQKKGASENAFYIEGNDIMTLELPSLLVSIDWV